MDGKKLLFVIAVLLVSVLMWVLLPTFSTFIKSADLQGLVVDANTTSVKNSTGDIVGYADTTYNAGWAGGLFMIIYVLAAALIPLGLIGYLGYQQFKK